MEASKYVGCPAFRGGTLMMEMIVPCDLSYLLNHVEPVVVCKQV